MKAQNRHLNKCVEKEGNAGAESTKKSNSVTSNWSTFLAAQQRESNLTVG